MARSDTNLKLVALVLVAGATLATFVVLQRLNYLLFHGLVELFSAAIAGAVFLLAVNARDFLGTNRFLLIPAVALAAVGFIDVLHTLAYRGMGVFPAAVSANLATQLWVAARLLFAGALIATVLAMHRQPRLWVLLAGHGVAALLLLASIFVWDVFPLCFVEGQGLTPFKIGSEYVVVAATLAAGVVLWFRRARIDERLWRLLLAAIALLAASELAFTHYSNPYAIGNMLGHLFKVAAFYLLYRAIVRIGVAEPFALLFRDLKRNEEALAEANEHLEQRVEERTRELAARQAQLFSLARQLAQVERRERHRIATLLHDELAQLLAVIRMRLARLDPARPDELQPSRDRLVQHTEAAIRFTRTLVARLTPPRIDEGGLPRALEALAGELRVHDVEATVTAPDDLPPIDPEAGEVVLRAVRELLMNVVKYAGTPQAVVVVRAEDGRLLVAVRDEGRGFDPATLPTAPTAEGGFGLVNVRTQLQALGGDLAIASAPGAGTTVTLSVPLGAGSPPEACREPGRADDGGPARP